MVESAIRSHPAFDGTQIKIYAKGSYANDTNVRLDSDVDIVVENHDCMYYDYSDNFDAPKAKPAPYSGRWTPEAWRAEVTRALNNHFGPGDVDTDGEIALVVSEVPGSRPSTDVVPSFDYRRYDDPAGRVAHAGSKVFKKSGDSIVNWPQQQLENGAIKNDAWFGTGGRYKKFARALKNAENVLADDGIIKPKPSYLMECLAWNVPDQVLTRGLLETGFHASLQWLCDRLSVEQYVREEWEEPNQLKYLFGSQQKWTVSDAREVVLAIWKYLEY